MATTKYLDANPLQPPYDVGTLDGNSRAVWIFNMILTKVPSASVTAELLAFLQDESVGTVGVDLFDGSKALIPSGDGPYLSILATGGAAGLRTHNVTSGPAYERPTVQVVVRGQDAALTETMARAAYNALSSIRNRALTVPV